MPRHEKLLLADLASVLVHGGQPLLDAGPVDEAHGAGAGAGGDQLVSIHVTIMTDATKHPRGSLASR